MGYQVPKAFLAMLNGWTPVPGGIVPSGPVEGMMTQVGEDGDAGMAELDALTDDEFIAQFSELMKTVGTLAMRATQGRPENDGLAIQVMRGGNRLLAAMQERRLDRAVAASRAEQLMENTDRRITLE